MKNTCGMQCRVSGTIGDTPDCVCAFVFVIRLITAFIPALPGGSMYKKRTPDTSYFNTQKVSKVCFKFCISSLFP